MPIKAVLFDMFDTLMMVRRNHDFYSPSLMRTYKFLNKNGIDVSFDTFEKAYIKARDELYARVDANLEEPHFNVRISEALKNLGYNYSASSQLVTEATAEFCDEFMTFVYLDPNTEKILRTLHGKYKLGIISNFAIPECVHELLKTHGLSELLDAVVVSAAVNKRKPSPEIFLNTLNALGVSAEETVFVGDTLDADIEGAKGAGIKAIYIERRIENSEGLVKPDKTIKSLGELPTVLKDL
ncbi:MAG: HAD family hydrolase [Candidatus Bathyarchaeia archaeon]|jgi:HAD superfamily hydrolase (TIGR01549 family)